MKGQTRQAINSGPSILSQFENMTPATAIAEYVWNALDANATQVAINYTTHNLTGISTIVITDNGDGICYQSLDQTFDKFLDSHKLRVRMPTTRGYRGKGRFSFCLFADFARWLSWQSGQSFTIDMASGHINEYVVSPPVPCDAAGSGTAVTLSPVTLNDERFVREVIPYIQGDISWLLLAKPGITITVDGNQLLPGEYKLASYNKTLGNSDFNIKIVQWAAKPSVDAAAIYCINSAAEVVYKELIEINTEDHPCTGYISSAWFDHFALDNELLGQDFPSLESEEFNQVLSYAKSCLHSASVAQRSTRLESGKVVEMNSSLIW